MAFGTVASTNDEARRFAEAGAAEGLIVTGGEQRAGRGRQGRAWASPVGNLYLSLLLRPAVKPGTAGAFGFGVAVAVAEAVERLAPGARARCKWPNDVLVEGRKIAGILLESRGTPDRLDWLVVGIGLNVAVGPVAAAWPATTLTTLGGGGDLEAALAVLAAQLDRWYRLWRDEGFAPLRAAWLSRAHTIGETLAVRRNGGQIEGRFAGLDPAGALLLDMADGRREALSYGEIVAAETRG
ncbi:MAG: biotin--[acetyl-CoA-carboxylase] ligase [Rhodospirillaceae bacterium]|nr:biotin--[acetyl-CoA-carboxylase] ligase [Rhodospirillaceae bacterium]